MASSLDGLNYSDAFKPNLALIPNLTGAYQSGFNAVQQVFDAQNQAVQQAQQRQQMAALLDRQQKQQQIDDLLTPGQVAVAQAKAKYDLDSFGPVNDLGVVGAGGSPFTSKGVGINAPLYSKGQSGSTPGGSNDPNSVALPTDPSSARPNTLTGSVSNASPPDANGFHLTTGTTFATPSDLANFQKTGSLATGDNGKGVWGDDTTTDTPQVALPPSTLKAYGIDPAKARGTPVTVQANGKTVQAIVTDHLPDNSPNGAGIDLNPGTAKSLGITDLNNFKGPVSFKVGASAASNAAQVQSAPSLPDDGSNPFATPSINRIPLNSPTPASTPAQTLASLSRFSPGRLDDSPFGLGSGIPRTLGGALPTLSSPSDSASATPSVTSLDGINGGLYSSRSPLGGPLVPVTDKLASSTAAAATPSAANALLPSGGPYQSPGIPRRLGISSAPLSPTADNASIAPGAVDGTPAPQSAGSQLGGLSGDPFTPRSPLTGPLQPQTVVPQFGWQMPDGSFAPTNDRHNPPAGAVWSRRFVPQVSPAMAANDRSQLDQLQKLGGDPGQYDLDQNDPNGSLTPQARAQLRSDIAAKYSGVKSAQLAAAQANAPIILPAAQSQDGSSTPAPVDPTAPFAPGHTLLPLIVTQSKDGVATQTENPALAHTLDSAKQSGVGFDEHTKVINGAPYIDITSLNHASSAGAQEMRAQGQQFANKYGLAQSAYDALNTYATRKLPRNGLEDNQAIINLLQTESPGTVPNGDARQAILETAGFGDVANRIKNKIFNADDPAFLSDKEVQDMLSAAKTSTLSKAKDYADFAALGPAGLAKKALAAANSQGAPGGTGKPIDPDMLIKAQAAIAKGASKQSVAARLTQSGYDASGL